MQISKTVKELLKEGTTNLLAKGIDNPRLDVEYLLARALRCDRSHLFTHEDQSVEVEECRVFEQDLKTRSRGLPLAQILGEWEFYSLDFRVTKDVLVPRPDTELLIDWALEIVNKEHGGKARLADVGTGSGCIAVTLAHHLKASTVDATDISRAALSVARRNATRHSVSERVKTLQGDFLEPLTGQYDLIVSNPPYIAKGDPKLETHVAAFEPNIALFDCAGDGYGFYRRFQQEVDSYLAPGGCLLMEVGEDQAEQVSELFSLMGYATEVRKDLSGIDRGVLARKVG